jgi:hypothetical protein
MAMTIKGLIAELSAIENQDQPVMYGYVLAEDIGAMDNGGDDYELTPEQFGEAIDSLSYDEDYFKGTMSDELWTDVQTYMEENYFDNEEDN